MFRPRDITDSIATAVVLLIILATAAITAIYVLGIRLPDVGSTDDGSLNSSVIEPLLRSNFLLNLDKMDPASKIILGSLIILMIFLLITMGWVYWYRYKEKNR